MTSLTELLSLLRQVRSVQFDASSEAATGWDGHGNGVVTVSEPSAAVVVFDEAGIWQPILPGRASVNFTNIFRWTAICNSLRLEHLRFGPDNPVLLFDLVPEEDRWREVRPHLCGDDFYTASLMVEDENVVVAWSIIGPRKQESIRYTYR